MATPQGFTITKANPSNREFLGCLFCVADVTRHGSTCRGGGGAFAWAHRWISGLRDMASRTDADHTPDEPSEMGVPLLAEEIAVAKQVVETGRVQVARVMHESS